MTKSTTGVAAVTDDRLLNERYRLQRPIADPAPWPTWLAIDERLGRAVTVLFPRSATDTMTVRRYSCLDDHRLVRVLDLDQSGPTGFLVTERYCGVTFSDLLSTGLLTGASAIELITEAAAAVAVVHSAGLAYGGLAADSICWTDSGLVKVLALPLSATNGTAAHDVESLRLMLRSALDADASRNLLSTLARTFRTAEELVSALEPFRSAEASLRRDLVSPEPVGAPHRMARCSVRELMVTDVVTVSEDTPVLELAELLANCQHPAVPVVDSAGRVTGMISSADLVRWQLGAVSV